MRHSIENPIKFTARARSLMGGMAGRLALTVELAAAYAAQNPGFEGANYRGAPAAYRSDARRAQQGLAACRDAILKCAAEHVNDGDMVEACRGERFEITGDAVGGYSAHYTTGQYFPVEFRWQVASVLERAARIARNRNR